MQKDDFQILRFRVFRDLHGIRSIRWRRKTQRWTSGLFPRSFAEAPDLAAEQPDIREATTDACQPKRAGAGNLAQDPADPTVVLFEKYHD